jgi:hypothetical protein
MKGRRRAIRSDIAVTTVFDESSTMDYLHGDVVDGEHEAACDYEYARESRVLRAAAGMHIAKRLGELTAEQWRAEFQKATERLEEQEGKRVPQENQVRPWDNERNRGDVFAPLTAEDVAALQEKGRLLSFDEICEEIDKTFSCGGLFLASPWLEILSCESFPETPWNGLSAEDRAGILRVFPLPYGKAPLRTVDGRVLKRLQAKGDLAAGQYSYVAVDLSKPKKQLSNGFAAWLELPENKERLKQHRHSQTGKTGVHKDRLKDLATWRLYKHCGNDWRKANNFASEHRRVFEKPETIVIRSGRKRVKILFKKGDPKPFHDLRRGQEKHRINEASLYSEESGFLKAKQRVQAYLKERIPWEFFKEAKDAELEEMRARWGATEPIAKEDLPELVKDAKASGTLCNSS